jgi:Flp pilus assembly protein TadG
MMKRCPALLHREHGSSAVEVALMAPILVLLLVGGVDFGRGYYVALEVSSAAESGALYGSLNTSDTTGMVAAAKLNATDVPGLTATASRGCECSDGTGAVASCSSVPTCAVNVVDFVEVDTAATYKPIFKFPGIPATFALTGKGRMRAGY